MNIIFPADIIQLHVFKIEIILIEHVDKDCLTLVHFQNKL